MLLLRDLQYGLFLSLATTTSCLSLPPPTGAYSVGVKSYLLNHTTLNDSVSPNNGTGVSILLTFYYPTLHRTAKRKYVYHGLADYYETYYNEHGVPLPSGAFYNITATIGSGTLALPKSMVPKLPTLLFGPPFAGPPSIGFTALLSDLASHGYTVIAVDHPYEQPFLEYPDGTGIPGLAIDVDSGPYIDPVSAYRASDTSALIAALPTLSQKLKIPVNLTHFALFGHSIGGSAALNQPLLGRNHTGYGSHAPIFLGALNLDGTDFGAFDNSSNSDIKIPSLLIASDIHPEDPTWDNFQSQQTSWTKRLLVEGKTNHTDFSDLILWKQSWGIAGGEGAIKAQRMIALTRTFVRNFFAFIDGKGEGVLSGSTMVQRKWPEVMFEYEANTGYKAHPMYRFLYLLRS